MTNYTKHVLGVLAVFGLFCVVPSSEQVQGGHPETTEPVTGAETTETAAGDVNVTNEQNSPEPETEQTEFVQFNLVIELPEGAFEGSSDQDYTVPEGKRLIADSVDCVGSGLIQEQISQLELTGDANEAGANAMHVSIVHIRSRFQIDPPGPNFQAYQLLNTWAPENTEIRSHIFRNDTNGSAIISCGVQGRLIDLQ